MCRRDIFVRSLVRFDLDDSVFLSKKDLGLPTYDLNVEQLLRAIIARSECHHGDSSFG